MKLRSQVFGRPARAVLCAALPVLLSLSLPFWDGGAGSFSAQAQVAIVNAASFATDQQIAPDTLATAFGAFVTQNNQLFVADTLPLPTSLGGVRVTIGGQAASLFFTSPGQINFIVPRGLGDGPAAVAVTNSDGSTRSGNVAIVRANPGLFTVRSTGSGAPVGSTTFDGAVFTPLANPDGSERDLDAGTRERPNFMILFGTGWRFTPAANPNDADGVAESITVTINGVPARIAFAGGSNFALAVDQINLIIPPELAGIGTARLRIAAAGRVSNTVTIRLGGQTPQVRADPLTADQAIFGALSADDQVQVDGDGSGRTYFFDGYGFRLTQAGSVAIELNSAFFDATLLLYRRNTEGFLTLVAADDQTGALGNGRDENDNALLLAQLAAGDYVIFATSAAGQANAIGGYSIRMRTGVIQAITYGANITDGAFTASDVRTSAGDYLDVYSFNGTAGDFVQIRMASTAVDSFLILNRGNGELLEFDDNAAGGTNALLSARLPASGTYLIIATPFEPNRTGAYTLTLNRTNGFAAPETPLGAVRAGRLMTRGLHETDLEHYARRVVLAKD